MAVVVDADVGEFHLAFRDGDRGADVGQPLLQPGEIGPASIRFRDQIGDLVDQAAALGVDREVVHRPVWVSRRFSSAFCASS